MRAHRLALAAASAAEIGAATIVVARGDALAVALRYEVGDAAPVVVGRGEAEHAAHVVRSAQAASVPVVDDGALAARLSEIDVGAEIDEALYDDVADVLRDRA
jgi:type III secretion system FlhB-like substrate exporter